MLSQQEKSIIYAGAKKAMSTAIQLYPDCTAVEHVEHVIKAFCDATKFSSFMGRPMTEQDIKEVKQIVVGLFLN